MTASNPHRAPLPPGYGLAPAAPAESPAPLGRRAGAYVVDMLIVGVVVSVLAGVTVWAAMNGPLWLTLTLSAVLGLLAIGWILLYSWWQGTRRGTPGMRALRVRLVRDDDGAPLGFGRALLRNVIWGLGAAIVVGYFSPLFDGSPWRRGWHDRVAGARMADAGSARDAAVAHQAGAQAGAARASFLPPAPVAPAPAVPPAPVAVPPRPPAPPAVAPAPAAPAVPAAAPAIPPRPPMPPAPLVPPAAPPAPPRVGGGSAPVAPPAPATPPPPPRSEPSAPAGVIAFVPGITQDPPAPVPAPEPAAPEPAAPEPAADALSDDTIVPGGDVHDGYDPLLDDTIVVRREPPRPTATIVWDDGAVHTVDGFTLFGRNPAGEGETVAVRDESLSLSKTHFALDVDADGAWITDRHSTNGVVIVRGGDRIDLVPGERTPLIEGDVLEMGDRTATYGAPA